MPKGILQDGIMIGTGKPDLKVRRLALALIPSILLLSCTEHAPESGMVLPAPSGVTLTLQDDTTALLVWEPVAEASHYYVAMQESESGNTVAEADSLAETAVLFEGLDSGSNYCRVRAINGMEYSDFASSEIITVVLPDTGTDPGTDPGTVTVTDPVNDTGTDPGTDTGRDPCSDIS